MQTNLTQLIGIATIYFITAFVQAAPAVPYTENFTTDAANWRSGANVAANFSASGGPDGSSHITINAAIQNPTMEEANQVLFRGQSNFNSSNHLFEGDWIAGGVNRFSAYVRHNAPGPLQYFARFTNPMAFPGIAAIPPFQVQPNVWTKLAFNISYANGNIELFPEGAPTEFNGQFTSVFSNLARIQVGVTLPANSGTATQYKFDLDQVTSNIPEPATGVLAMLAAAAMTIRRGRS